MPDKIVNHFVLADGSTAKYSAEHLAGDVPEVVDIRTGYDGTVYSSAGDAVREQVNNLHVSLKDATGNDAINSWVDGWFISTHGTTYDPNGAVFNASFRYAIVDCLPGDKFTVAGIGGGNPRLWAFADSNNNILSHADNDATATKLVITAPEGSSKLILNDKSKLYNSYYGALLYEHVNTISEIVSELTIVDFVENSGYYYSDGGIAVAGQVTKEVYTNNIFCVNGETFKFQLDYTAVHELWLAYALFDKFGQFISRVVIASGNYISYGTDVKINNSNACYISFTYRTYGDASVTIKSAQTQMTNKRFDVIEDNIMLFDYSINENVKSVNHRGFYTAPENTLPAYKLSKKNGFKYVECDVSMTSDRVPVLLHDNTINRTARNADGTEISGDISIGSITYEQALQYDFGIYKGSQYAGTKIPTFEQFITLCRNLGLHPYIELKDGGGYTETEIQNLIDIVRQNGMAGKVTWISFNEYYLEHVKNYDNSARLGLVASALTSANITTASSLKTTTNEVFLDVSSISDDLVDDCITAGLPVEVWTINTTAGITALNDYISGVTSDNLIASKVLYEENI